jgi:hypothetical protein
MKACQLIVITLFNLAVCHDQNMTFCHQFHGTASIPGYIAPPLEPLQLYLTS